MTTYTGDEPSIQRMIRRGYQILGDNIPGGISVQHDFLMHALLKATTIAVAEDAANYWGVTIPETPTPDALGLPPIPQDPDA